LAGWTINSAKKAASRGGVQKGDLVIAAGPNPAPPPGTLCGLLEITANSSADGLTDGASIGHTNGAYTNYLGTAVTSRYNPAGAAGLGLAFTTGELYDLGPTPQLNVWQIRNGRTLAWSDDLHNSGVWTEVSEGVINLQAQYGTATDANANGNCDPAESVALAWSVNVPANWSCMRAVRVALLARGQQYEKDPVTATAPAWAGGSFVMTNVDGTADSSSGDANDWRHYRYRVYETVVPLRNVIWGQCPPLMCP
jgi:type IV pilus assembly protein PilW